VRGERGKRGEVREGRGERGQRGERGERRERGAPAWFASIVQLNSIYILYPLDPIYLVPSRVV
jgi:hypothetical protein